ncbi:protein synthesis inhibitor PD-S2-like [Silene latifolia]|uniref:protein synthesis inhibitor PD-S2-like n=1 Tax=Silene latifolia TaxID=37657 RepID=UPI003D77FD15
MRLEVVLRVAAAITLTCMFLVIVPATCQDVSFNLRRDGYAKFVEEVRKQVNSSGLQYHGIDMINPPNQRNLYLYVNLNARLTNNQAFTMGLQLRRSDLYVLAYRDQVDGRTNRAFYFRGEIPERDVFPRIANLQRLPMRVQFDYVSLESAAGQLINSLQFGVASLESEMRNMYGRKDVSSTNPFRRDQARFLLITIHMVAEAARFIYIEKKGDFSLRSDYQVKSMVNNWGTLSVQIATSGPSGVFRNPVTLQVTSNRYWTITNVNQIKPDMGLLKYERVLSDNLNDNVDDDDDKLPRSSLEDAQIGRAIAY